MLPVFLFIMILLALLNDPNFQYNYVNALHESGSEGEFLTAFKTMLQAAGFYFLGEKIKKYWRRRFLIR